MSIDDTTLWGLFLSAFISSTLFPGGSEIVLGALVAQGTHDSWTLFSVATLGNTLGGMSTWALGWLLGWWYPLTQLSKPRQRQAVARLQKWGSPALLGSWIPVVGDPLCLAAGWLRIHVGIAFLFIALGKGARYAAIIAALT